VATVKSPAGSRGGFTRWPTRRGSASSSARPPVVPDPEGRRDRHRSPPRAV